MFKYSKSLWNRVILLVKQILYFLYFTLFMLSIKFQNGYKDCIFQNLRLSMTKTAIAMITSTKTQKNSIESIVCNFFKIYLMIKRQDIQAPIIFCLSFKGLLLDEENPLDPGEIGGSLKVSILILKQIFVKCLWLMLHHSEGRKRQWILNRSSVKAATWRYELILQYVKHDLSIINPAF